MHAEIFVSYAHADQAVAKDIVNLIRDGGYIVFYDPDLVGGKNWEKQLVETIQRCSALVFLMTAEALDSEWCRREVKEALEQGKTVVPILLQSDLMAPVEISQVQWIDFTKGSTPRAVAKLMQALRACLSTKEPSAQVEQQTQRVSGKLEVSDILIEENGDSAVVDFRATNLGDAEVIVNKVEFEALIVVEFSGLGFFEYSKIYDLDISEIRDAGDTISCNTAQLIRPGEVDRFGIRFIAMNMGMGKIRGWRFQPTLHTNFGSVAGPPFGVWLPFLVSLNIDGPYLTAYKPMTIDEAIQRIDALAKRDEEKHGVSQDGETRWYRYSRKPI